MTKTSNLQPSALQAVIKEAKRAIRPLIWFSAGINVLMLTGSFYMLQVYHRVLCSHSLETLVMLSLMAAARPRHNGADWKWCAVASPRDRRLVDERAPRPGPADRLRRARRHVARSG